MNQKRWSLVKKYSKIIVSIIFVLSLLSKFGVFDFMSVKAEPSFEQKLQSQITECWSGIPNQEVVILSLIMNKDRTIRHIEVKDKARYTNDPSYKASADTAIKALQKPSCQKLVLPENQYEDWKEIVLTFDPKDRP